MPRTARSEVPRDNENRIRGDGARLGKEVQMPRTHLPAFRQHALEHACLSEHTVAQIATDNGVSDSFLRAWMSGANHDEGRRSAGVNTDTPAGP